MEKISCIILEDDEISSKILQGLIEKSGLLNFKMAFESPTEAIPWLLENKIDIIFLDVEMPGMSGLDMIRTLDYRPEIIIVSGRPDYAIEAFNLSVTDFLVKPVTDYGRFIEAVKKVVSKRKVISTPSNESANHLYIKVNNLLQKIEMNAVLYIEAFGDYVKIRTIEDTHTVYSSLKKLEEKLDDSIFVRIHRSYIINVNKITNIDPNNLEINKKIIPISGLYKEQLMDKIKIL